MKKNISILGSTGSIGVQTLQVVDRFPDNFRVVGLAAGNNVELLIEQCNKYKPQVVAIRESSSAHLLAEGIKNLDIDIYSGEESANTVATMESADIVMAAIVGFAGLKPTIEAIKKGKDIALANKETLVAAGEIVMSLAESKNARILPVDSEHSAIFQCLQGCKREELDKLVLTASGGPFKGFTKKELSQVSIQSALNHPNWSMGHKITIDSATMMNKGLEVIEAKWLFNMSLEKIEVVVHPESIIHSMVLFNDGAMLAQLGLPDMAVPIQYALTYPHRKSIDDSERLDLCEINKLTFTAPDLDSFPCLALAYEAGKIGGTMPAVMNAANEIAVGCFLEEKIDFINIPSIIEKVMNKHILTKEPKLADVVESDLWARSEAKNFISR